MDTQADSSSEQDSQNLILKKRRSKNAKRFSDEQIRSLESIFKLETKLEPRKKLQVAKDLGLHPRQVAIWFQNRRARWKSKHIEQEYKALKARFDCMQLQCDDLKREKQSLQMQLKELSDLLKNRHKNDPTDRDAELKNDNENSHNEEQQLIKCFGKTEEEEEEEEEEILSWGEEQEISHLAAPETWCNLSSAGIFDQSSSTSEWWENE